MKHMKVLVTGGTGYIGSHTTVALIEEGYDVVIVDNLSNSSAKVLDRIYDITSVKPDFYQVDITDYNALKKVFRDHAIDAVIHFAALKAPAISVNKPLLYYQNNIDATLVLAKVMQENGTKKMVFSSSAAVYGIPSEIPISEKATASSSTNPYGQTKVVCERILQDLSVSDPSINITLLRYFNPIGAHTSGLIGEDPNGPPNNLVPYLSQVAVGKRSCLMLYGNDYETPDGTGIRDYIHISDLVDGHLAALKSSSKPGKASVYNLGTGKGSSVLETLKAFEKASNKKIPYKLMPRRKGDIASCYADPSKAKKELGWTAKKTLQEMCEDAWKWQSMNPEGYGK